MVSILCVDDELPTRALLARLLTRNGYRVLQASSVRGALGMIQREPGLALIVLDLNMPEVTGFDALKLLKADERTFAIPVVVVTASSRPEDLARALEMGALEVIGNPVTDDRILAAVARAIGGGSLPIAES